MEKIIEIKIINNDPADRGNQGTINGSKIVVLGMGVTAIKV